MIYVINSLKKLAEKHMAEIKELQEVDHEMNASMIFTEEEIEHHKGCIKQINEAINKLK